MVIQSGGTVAREVSVLDVFRRHKDLKPEGIAELNEAGLKLARVLAEEVAESLDGGDRKTGFQTVREDGASRLSANATTGLKPVGHDRQDAGPPANRTVPGEPPMKGEHHV
jgi:hypothetical protein